MNRTLKLELAPRGNYPLRASEWAERIARVVDTVEIWQRRHRTRQQLAMADTRILRDIGVSEADRAIECNKPFWEA